MSRYDIEQTISLLSGARALVAKRSGWTKRALARDRHSHPVAADNSRAVRFCAGGALIRAFADEGGRVVWSDDGIVWETLEELHLPLILLGRNLGAAIIELYAIQLCRFFLAELMLAETGEGPGVRLYRRLVTDGNDLPLVRHAHILKAFDGALEAARALRSQP